MKFGIVIQRLGEKLQNWALDKKIRNAIVEWDNTGNQKHLFEYVSSEVGVTTTALSLILQADNDLQAFAQPYVKKSDEIRDKQRNEHYQAECERLANFLSQLDERGETREINHLRTVDGFVRPVLRQVASENPELWNRTTTINSPTNKYAVNQSARVVVDETALKSYLQQAVDELRLVTKEELMTKFGCKRPDLKRFAAANTELWKLALIPRSRKELIRTQTERAEAEQRERDRQEQLLKVTPQPFGSYAACGLAYEKGQLVKKLTFKLSCKEMDEVFGPDCFQYGFFFDGKKHIGIYSQENEEIATFPICKARDYVRFDMIWNPRICKEPEVGSRVPLSLNKTTSQHKRGVWFVLQPKFFCDYKYR